MGAIRMRTVLLWASLAGVLLCQIAANIALAPLRPAIEEMPYPPNARAMKALALGDDQFLFRSEVSWLQSFGDGGGRVRPLKDYDYGRVTNWLREVGRLDPQSQSMFILGSTYFGAISDPATASAKIKLLADYFEEAGAADPARRWTWLVWAAGKIQHVVKDPTLARRTADDIRSLAKDSAVPYWLPLLAVPLYRVAGDVEMAATLDADLDMIALRRRALKEMMGHFQKSGPENP